MARRRGDGGGTRWRCRGLTLWAEHVLQQSVEIVPLLEGTLERSGAVSPANAESLTAAVSYDTPYAVRQHEDLTYHYPNGRQAKYLETPLNASVDTGKALVAEEIHAALTGGRLRPSYRRPRTPRPPTTAAARTWVTWSATWPAWRRSWST